MSRIRTAGPGATPPIQVTVTPPPVTGSDAQVTGAPVVQPSKQAVSAAKIAAPERRQRRAPAEIRTEPIAQRTLRTVPVATG